MMERTAATLVVYPPRDDGQATVGFEVCVKHVGGGARRDAAAPPWLGSRRSSTTASCGSSVEVMADDGRTIGVGTHERRIVDGPEPVR